MEEVTRRARRTTGAAGPAQGAGGGDPRRPDGPSREAGAGNGPEAAGRRPAAREGRRGRWVVLAVVVALLVWGGVAGWLVVGSRGDLLAARAAADRGLGAALDGEVGPAADAFAASRDGFRRAEGRLGNPLVAVLGPVPVAGTNLRAVRDLAAAGGAVADAGERVTRTVADLPGGIEALAPSGGALPVDALEIVGPRVTEARDLLGEAAVALDRVPAEGLVPQVADARTALADQLDPARQTVDRAEPLVRALPALLGAEGPRRYFFGAAQPAELRGNTGFIGAYAILTLDQGRFAFGDFGPIQDLPVLPPGTVAPPTPDFLPRYGQLGGTGFWQNLNVSPDFPTTGTAIERLWETTTGERLDGTITADPFALAALLELAGPTEVPGFGTVDAQTVVPFVSNEAYAVFTDPEERKRLLGQVAAAALGGFLERGLDGADGGGGALDVLRALGDTAGAGHLRVHAADPQVQAALDAAGLAGALADPDGDYLGLYLNGASGTKIDFYLDAALEAVVTPRPDGSAATQATLRLRNDAPTTGQPTYTIGPNSPRVTAGTSELYVAAHLAGTGRLAAVTGDGQPVNGRLGSELGHPVVETFETIPSGATRTLSYRVVTDAAWETSQEGGTYRLTLQQQPLIRPLRLDLVIEAPEGMVVRSAEAPLQVDGRRVRYTGKPAGDLVLEVRFAPNGEPRSP